MWRSKKCFWRRFSRSCILWLKNWILNWSLSFFHTNSRLWIKCPIIHTHHGQRILYTSSKSQSRCSICSRTKKLVATSKLWSSKGSCCSKSQTTFSICLPACQRWLGCLCNNLSAISHATYLAGCRGVKNLWSLPSPAPKSIRAIFFCFGRYLTKTPFSKLSRCWWKVQYWSAMVLYHVRGSWIKICFWL